MHDAWLTLAEALVLAVIMRRVVRWCECSSERALLEASISPDVHSWETPAADAIPNFQPATLLRESMTAVVAQRHAHAIRTAASPLLCPMCHVGNLRKACVVVPIYDVATHQVVTETWCPDCGPLITGGWIAPAAKEFI